MMLLGTPRTASVLVSALCLASLAVGCGGGATPPAEPPPAPEPATEPAEPAPAEPATEEPGAAEQPAAPLEVQIVARSKSKLTGTATFEETEGGVKVTVRLSNAPPGLHGAHIHEKADCSADDASSAGDHFNPGGHPHGRPPEEKRHLGDLGNIEVDPGGKGVLEIVIPGANLKPGDPSSFLDRAVIVHEKEDVGSQPAGGAGARIGCGEIKR